MAEKICTRNKSFAQHSGSRKYFHASAMLLVVLSLLTFQQLYFSSTRIIDYDVNDSHLSKALTQAHQVNDCLSKIDNVRGVKLYSQNDEDGALLQTLRCMGGHGGKEYFEFGSETGVQVNTRILRDLYGWKGHLLDGGNENPDIPLHKEWFTPSNIVSLLKKYDVSKNLDVLSVDTDFDDLYITREILLAGYRPRVLITEFNINFGSDWAVSVVAKRVGKEAIDVWKGDCYFGVSALGIIYLAKAFGYTPVFSNSINLIFVQIDEALEKNMIIPSPDNFPRMHPTKLHPNCSGRTWKLIDLETMKFKATDVNIKHADFAAGFTDITLEAKDVDEKWRVFKEA